MGLRQTTIPREQRDTTASSEAAIATLCAVYARGRRAEVPPVPIAQGAAVVIGREPPPGGIMVDDDGWVSRHHAKVSRAPGDDLLIAEDLGSKNGTWVDGQRITGRVALGPGHVLRVGATVFVSGLRAAAIAPNVAPPADFVATSPAMLALWQRIVIVAASDEPIVIVGEIGSGKTAVARLVHTLSRRAGGPFVPHNSSAIPPNLEDATLFGVAPGFIPGVSARAGLLAQADGGTLFLDELGDLPAPAQAKLLDAFDPNAPSFLPVGAPKRVPTRCRLVVAVQRDLFELVAAGRLRHDLASRLAVARLDVPSLRERREDVLTLFAQALSRASSVGFDEVVREPEIAEALLLAQWTENVRGLESLARRVGLGETLSVALISAHADRGAIATTSSPSSPSSSSSPSFSAPSASPATAPRPLSASASVARVVWPPEPGELLDLLASHGFEVTPVAEHFARTRETVGRHLTKTFGPGGKDVVKRAYRVWHASGRAPAAGEVARAYALWFDQSPADADPSDALQTARARWSREGLLD